MSRESAFIGSPGYQPTEWTEFRGVRMASRFTTVEQEYRAAHEAAALFDRSHRGLIVATGADRQTWLHNLVTNTVRDLSPGDGVYAFATDVKGRTQFDLNILVLADALWLDVDRPTAPAAQAHLERFLITEDVALTDAGERFARLGCAGPAAADVAKSLGVGNLTPMPALAGAWIDDPRVRLVRHDFAGRTGFELFVPIDEAGRWWQRLAAMPGVTPAGTAATEALRIEAGIPAWGFDIDEKVIPPETGQIERGISYNKGCYLGQEIIERMRSFGSVARRLVKLEVADGAGVSPPAPLVQKGKEIGRVTSLIRHPESGPWIGLGYVRASLADATGLMVGDPPRPVRLR
jgi:folate-binding protein YgfZ